MAREQIDGELDIKAGTITDASVSATAAIAETKLALAHDTATLYADAVLTNEDRTIQEGIFMTIPATGFKMRDAVNNKTYKFTLQNGVLVAEEV